MGKLQIGIYSRARFPTICRNPIRSLPQREIWIQDPDSKLKAQEIAYNGKNNSKVTYLQNQYPFATYSVVDPDPQKSTLNSIESTGISLIVRLKSYLKGWPAPLRCITGS
jgi:hypothetical protein